MRQNLLTDMDGLPPALELEDLDLYDNRISFITNLDAFTRLKCGLKFAIFYARNLDLSFNLIKRIEHLEKLTQLETLYFVQNKISIMCNLEPFSNLRILELGANRIRKIEGLDQCKNLEELYVGKNKITQIEVFVGSSNVN
jgi:protein phosphatase 1 regulatory subunit 7